MLNKNLDFVKNILDKKGEFTVLFVGDSLTAAEWVHPNFRDIVEYALKEVLISYSTEEKESWSIPSWGIRFINCGYDGITSKELLEKLDKYVLKYNPDLTLLMVNSNDIDFNITTEESKSNIKQITKALYDKNGRTIYISNPASINKNWSEKYKKYLEFPENFFDESKTEYINLFEKIQEFDLTQFYTFESDGNPDMGMAAGEIDWAHPNILGNAYIAHILLKEIFGITFNPNQYLKELQSNKIINPKFSQRF